jgi:hypothetical protein
LRAAIAEERAMIEQLREENAQLVKVAEEMRGDVNAVLAVLDVGDRAPPPDEPDKKERLTIIAWCGADLDITRRRAWPLEAIRAQRAYGMRELARRLTRERRRGVRPNLDERQDIAYRVVVAFDSPNSRALYNRCKPTLRARGIRCRFASLNIDAASEAELVAIVTREHDARLAEHALGDIAKRGARAIPALLTSIPALQALTLSTALTPPTYDDVVTMNA